MCFYRTLLKLAICISEIVDKRNRKIITCHLRRTTIQDEMLDSREESQQDNNESNISYKPTNRHSQHTVMTGVNFAQHNCIVPLRSTSVINHLKLLLKLR